MTRLKVLFKTKGGHCEGMGDVTSSLVIGEEFKRAGNDIYFLINNNKNVVDLISKNRLNFSVVKEIEEIESFLRNHFFDIVILNQLNTPEPEAMLFKNSSKRLVSIEDTGQGAQLADIRFNVLYPIDNAITDFKFIPLAPMFQKRHNMNKVIRERVESILVTQGGSDTYGFTPKILNALRGVSDSTKINVVLGPNFSHYSKLETVLNSSLRDFDIVKDNDELSGLMMGSDLAISAGGNTLFELACIGVPTIIVCGEKFEIETAERLQKEGFAINLGFGQYVKEKDITSSVNKLIDDFSLRKSMSLKGKTLIDGQGTRRMVKKIIESI